MSEKSSMAPFILASGRGLFFLLIQAIIAFLYCINGDSDSLNSSSAWWPLSVTVVNLIYLVILVQLYRSEGKRYWDIFIPGRGTVKSDLKIIALFFIVAGPVAMGPNIFLGHFLFGDSRIPLELFLKPLPLWGIIAALTLFPLTQALVELPVYFLYSLPGIAASTGSRRGALVFTAIFLGLQHAAVPFILNREFLIWRALMFIPFAFLAGGLLLWRPRLLPYMAIIHFFMDLSVGVMYLTGGLVR